MSIEMHERGSCETCSSNCTDACVGCEEGSLWAPDCSTCANQTKPMSCSECEGCYDSDGYPGYAPGIKRIDYDYAVFKDGDQWCAVKRGFVNVQESPCAFAATPAAALMRLED